MFTEIKDGEHLLILGKYGVTINKTENGAEIVLHQPTARIEGVLTIRTCCTPYSATVEFADGTTRVVDLSDTDDWGNLSGEAFEKTDGTNADEPFVGYGNAEDGYKEIVRVTDTWGDEIPLEVFANDLKDLLYLHEG